MNDEPVVVTLDMLLEKEGRIPVRCKPRSTTRRRVASTTNVSEEWRPVPGLEHFLVSSLGNVMHAKNRKLRATCIDKGGYPRVGLTKPGGSKVYKVHHLVALAFIGPRPDGAVVNHIDGVKTNNRSDNLEYATPRGNLIHAFRSGLRPSLVDYKLSEKDTLRIKRVLDLLTTAQIARAFGVTEETVKTIRRRYRKN